MTKQEFEQRLGKQVNSADYSIIEYVYTFHPSIGDVGGKDQISELYQLGGMRLIKDMLPTAQKAEKLEDEIMETRASLNRLTKQYEALKTGAEEE